jgi:hypothetical protein
VDNNRVRHQRCGTCRRPLDAHDRHDLQRAFAVWWEPGYADLRLDGFLANSVEPWGLLAAPVSLDVRDTEQAPYCSASSDPGLSQVLADEWPHETVLAALP